MARIKFIMPATIESKEPWIKKIRFTLIGTIIIIAILLVVVLFFIQYWSKEYGETFEQKTMELRELQQEKIK